mmetsp:Transcript_31155/g.36557  ORF Transcript_31155/g.36557 Transcript_31155/m.36557 type:complete len:96 (+) Transcript_31155:99-386(+)
MLGNLEYAAEIALKCGRTTTALLIAEKGGPDLLEEIKQRYFEHEKDSFINTVVRSINDGDLTRLTDAENLRNQHENAGTTPTNWRESLAYLFAYF